MMVALTDGRSQDEVKKSSEKLQHSGRHGVINFSYGVCSAECKC